MHYQKFLEAVGKEIEHLIATEAKLPTAKGQHELHLLLENRHCVEKMMHEHHGNMAGTEPPSKPGHHPY